MRIIDDFNFVDIDKDVSKLRLYYQYEHTLHYCRNNLYHTIERQGGGFGFYGREFKKKDPPVRDHTLLLVR